MTDPYGPANQVPQGYLPPANVYQPLPSDGAPDPLVNPAFSGVGGWFTRIGWLFQRSWKSMAAIFAITTLLPGVILTVVFASIGLAIVMQSDRYIEPTQEWIAVGVPVLILSALLVVALVYFVQMIGYASATYAVTKQAAGYRVGVGEALRYGARRAPGLFGWQFLSALLVMVGFLACFLPAFYVIAAVALVGPIYLFERRNPIGRSFSIFNSNLGRVLGRLALILAANILGSGITNVFDLVSERIVGYSPTDLGLVMGAAMISALLSVIIQLPLTMLTFSGILLTYAEQRSYEGEATARTLADEL